MKYNTLYGADSIGRKLPEQAIAGEKRENRLVGLFYFLWCGEHGKHKAYDVSKIIADDPQAGYKPDSPVWGDIGVYHHWGEPLYGYYYSDDEWVIRHHMKLLTLAEVDFLFFDTTNAAIYEKNVKIVMRVLEEYYKDGWKIPKVMFYTNTDSGKTAEKIYNTIYEANYMPDTWFYYKGKPCIIAKKNECNPKLQEFFTIKEAQWPNEADKQNGWPWMDFTRPQRVFDDLEGKPEVINASVAQHPQLRFGDSVLYGETTNCGRAFHNGTNDPEPEAYKYGYNFGEQLERALETDPPVTLITGWNEWIAGRWQGIPERPIMFVDCANYEYSRDIEMMRGGYQDNYYMQMISYIRKYKGMDAIPNEKVPLSIAVTGDFSQWDAIEATYQNFADGAFVRCAQGSDTVYKNDTGRNEILMAKTTQDEEKVYFYVKTKESITAHTGNGAWMRLYLITQNGDGNHYTANFAPKSATITTLFADGKEVADLPYRYNESELMLEVPKIFLPKGNLWFKWADSTKEYETAENFYEYGDVAPIGSLYFGYMVQ